MALAGGRAHAEMIDGIVAVVDDTIIMVSDLQERMEALGAPLNNKKAERQVLELMVEDIVVGKIYTSLGLPPVGDKEAEAFAEKSGMSVHDSRNYIMKAALMDMMVRSRVVVTENMVRSFYETQPQYRGKDSVRLSQILIKGDSARTAKAIEELRAGKAFAEAAQQYSDALSSGSADIGWVAVTDLSEEVRAALNAVKPGDIVGPLAMNGYQAIYQLTERGVHGTRPLQEVREEITAELQKKYQVEAFNHWLEKMMSQYFIGIYI
jgi:parvulin-like peptidyl-prolyl isomerase